jgi:hypothetical protein
MAMSDPQQQSPQMVYAPGATYFSWLRQRGTRGPGYQQIHLLVFGSNTQRGRLIVLRTTIDAWLRQDARLPVSVITISKLKVPAALGVPLIVPEGASRASPGGISF